MGKQHETIPDEPLEAPVQPVNPEVRQPREPNDAPVPQEAPQNEPAELPQQPEIKPGDGSEFNRTEV
jgi:hypothetical protein